MSKLPYQIRQILLLAEFLVALPEEIFVNLQSKVFYHLATELFREFDELGFQPIPDKHDETKQSISFWLEAAGHPLLIQCQYQPIVLH